MPTSTNKQPLFSIIVPAYNCKETLSQLLQSLVKQELSKNQLEIIISDDCSTENYDQIINNFKDKLNIKKVLSLYNGGCGNARQNGVQHAQGKYITFIDSDDIYVPKVFQIIKNFLINNLDVDYIVTGLQYRTLDNKVLMRYSPSITGIENGYLHGKIFNLENFWKKYNLHFPKDQRTHEDISLTFQLMAIEKIFQEKIKIYATDLVTYIWYKYPNSFTNRPHYYKNEKISRDFSDKYFNNYVKATLQTLLETYKKYNYNKTESFASCCKCLYLIYERSERNSYWNPIIIKENYEQLYLIIQKMLNYFNITLLDIKTYIFKISKQIKQIELYAHSTSRPYECKYDFSEWLDLVYNKQLLKGESK